MTQKPVVHTVQFLEWLRQLKAFPQVYVSTDCTMQSLMANEVWLHLLDEPRQASSNPGEAAVDACMHKSCIRARQLSGQAVVHTS